MLSLTGAGEKAKSPNTFPIAPHLTVALAGLVFAVFGSISTALSQTAAEEQTAAAVPAATAAPTALWYASNPDTVHHRAGDDVAAIPPAWLTKNGVPERVKITESILTNAMGVAFHNGNLWVATMNNHVYEFQKAQLLKLSSVPKPTPAMDITSPNFQFILGCVFDPAGALWVVDSKFNGIHKFAASQLGPGPRVRNLTAPVNITSSDFASPAFATFDKGGNLWVSSTDNSRLLEFYKDRLGESGHLVPDIIIEGLSLDEPGEIQFDSDGNLWVPNSGSSTIVEFTANELKASGRPTAHLSLTATTIDNRRTIDIPWGMAFDPAGNLWVSNYIDTSTQTEGSISKFPPSERTKNGAPKPPVFLIGLPPYAGEVAFGPAPN